MSSLNDLFGAAHVNASIAEMFQKSMPVYDRFRSDFSRSLLRSGFLDTLQQARLPVTEGLQLQALYAGTELSRLLAGPTYLSAVASAVEARERLVDIVRGPAWIKMLERPQLDFLQTFSRDVSLVTAGLDRNLGRLARAPGFLEVERSVAITTRAWDDIVRRLPTKPSEDDAARLFGSGRGTLGLVTAGSLLVDDHDEASEDAETEELLSREGLDAQLRARLDDLHPGLTSQLDAAWDRVRGAGPAAASQAAHSLMELVDWSLRSAAPDADVLAWHSAEGRPESELHQGRPTRSTRAKFILRERPDDRTAARLYLRALNDLVETVQGFKHDLEDRDVLAVARLIPTVEGLLIFLFVQ